MGKRVTPASRRLFNQLLQEGLTMAAENLTGMQFGRLTALNRLDSDKYYHAKWLCLCQCGNHTPVLASCLKRGNTLSCGCLRIENRTKHGQCKSLTYNSWDAMIQRCTNSKHRYFEGYGGRGITICQEWLNSFINFLTDMGERPDKRHTLDRINVNKGYYKENCRWATPEVQACNKRPKRLPEPVPF